MSRTLRGLDAIAGAEGERVEIALVMRLDRIVRDSVRWLVRAHEHRVDRVTLGAVSRRRLGPIDISANRALPGLHSPFEAATTAPPVIPVDVDKCGRTS